MRVALSCGGVWCEDVGGGVREEVRWWRCGQWRGRVEVNVVGVGGERGTSGW